MAQAHDDREFDAVVCVGPAHGRTATVAIGRLAQFAGPRRILVITSRTNRAWLNGVGAQATPVEVLDEDRVIPGVSLDAIRAYLRDRKADPARAGWYLQQFLKMAACRLAGLAERFLIWDSDTFLLRPIEFFGGDGRALIHPTSEHHLPYFDTCRALLGIERGVGYSFVAESLPVKKDYMLRLLDAIEARSSAKRGWPWTILDAIDSRQLSGSGFSEFETYGNFVVSFDPAHFVVRPLCTWRYGATKFGLVPSRYDLERLALDYDYVSFEAWTAGPPRRILREKAVSVLLHVVAHPATPWGRAWRRRRSRT